MENLNAKWREQLSEKGISEAQLQEQLENFKKGFPFARLTGAAVEDNGVLVFGEEQREKYRRLYREKASSESILKFVPASGAATRMFKNLYAFYEKLKASSTAEEPTADVREFFDNLHRYAFYNELDEAVKRISGADLKQCMDEKKYLAVLDALLENPKGLGYGKKPKALLRFHAYPDGNRLALEEHLVEGALYAQSGGVCRLHFTLSPEHRADFEAAVKAALPHYEKKFNIRYDIFYSEQKSSTDTVAVTLDNRIFTDAEGKMVFRPGGHGALIENLNEMDADVIFIKNIDNVTTDALREDTVAYKELLAGVLMECREAVYGCLEKMETMTQVYPSFLQEVRALVCGKLGMKLPDNFDSMGQRAQLEYFRAVLDRPMRVCGVVRNTGEPGGGPFWVLSEGEKAPSRQIVESSQVDRAAADQRQIFETSRFFNPVDLVCSLYNHKHEKYDLRRFVDPQTAFISQKSVKGTDIKAMELPGLWNGAMARWITLFVEVPQSVFTPVKTVNDLLRKEHQNL